MVDDDAVGRDFSCGEFEPDLFLDGSKEAGRPCGACLFELAKLRVVGGPVEIEVVVSGEAVAVDNGAVEQVGPHVGGELGHGEVSHLQATEAMWKGELEAVGEQFLYQDPHLVNIGVTAHIGDAVDVLALGIQPRWGSGDLMDVEVVGKGDEVVDAELVQGQVTAFVVEDQVRMDGRIIRLDGGDVKIGFGVGGHLPATSRRRRNSPCGFCVARTRLKDQAEEAWAQVPWMDAPSALGWPV